ncbi:hypothetical protein AVEN_49160-1 [Araneus ventricosus]|uniref:Uncharacterized protein n=1 Tax=Araneus ventricosus TaxID=182803 RepID=A0A4Y2C005_ARAVE|nr:hypothetical protein AVEN_49160-1 [Araneus ventricosus]
MVERSGNVLYLLPSVFEGKLCVVIPCFMDGLQFTKNAVAVDIHSSAASTHRAQETHEAVRADPLRRWRQRAGLGLPATGPPIYDAKCRGGRIWRLIAPEKCQYLNKAFAFYGKVFVLFPRRVKSRIRVI